MTGLFLRLARQVVGPEPLRARTTARLPFAGPPALEVPQIPAPRQAVAAPTAGRIDSDPAAEERREAVPPAPPPLMAPAADRREDGPPQRDERRAAPEIVTAGHAAPAEGQEAEDAAPRAEAVLSPPTAPVRGADPPPDRAASAVEVHQRLVVAEPPATPSPVAARPDALLPEVWPPATADRRGRTPAPDRTSAAEPASPPEVHVHIGRIEVTSVADRQPSREPAMRRAPAMSLEDYLAKRRTGG